MPGIVNVRRLGRHPVELDDFQILTAAKITDRWHTDIITPKIEAAEITADAVDRGGKLGCCQVPAVQEKRPLTMRTQLYQGKCFSCG
jgi:hypothetical protein